MTPGQVAYEKAQELNSGLPQKWEDLYISAQGYWEAIAKAAIHYDRADKNGLYAQLHILNNRIEALETKND